MRIVFMGTPHFAVPILENLVAHGYEVLAVVTQPDRAQGRKKVLTAPPVKEVAVKHGIPVLQPENLKQSEELRQIILLAPDLIVTAAYGQLLPAALLDAPPLGCVNVHASLLPEYRGGAPVHQAIIDGRTHTGVTIMYMTEQLDAGNILAQETVPILKDDDVGSMFIKLSEAGAKLLMRTLPALQKGEIKSIPQDESKVTYAPNIQRKDERIDWNMAGKDIYNFIRGLHPFPGAFTTLHGEVVKIWSCQLTGDKDLTVPAGTIYKLSPTDMRVAAGDGTGINIQQLQPAGKKRMTTADFLRGIGQKWTEGLQFDRAPHQSAD